MRASPTIPLIAHPQCLSIYTQQLVKGLAQIFWRNMVNWPVSQQLLTSTSFSDLLGSISFEGSFFSTPRTTPSLVLTPMAVEPNFNQVLVNQKFLPNDIFQRLHHHSLCIVVKTYLDGLDGILNLIDSAFRWESVDTTIVVLFAIHKDWLDSWCKGIWVRFFFHYTYLPIHIL